MIKKNVAITLLIIAIILVGISVYTYISGDSRVSSSAETGNLVDDGSGKVGVEILPQPLEDKGNGN